MLTIKATKENGKKFDTLWLQGKNCSINLNNLFATITGEITREALADAIEEHLEELNK